MVEDSSDGRDVVSISAVSDNSSIVETLYFPPWKRWKPSRYQAATKTRCGWRARASPGHKNVCIHGIRRKRVSIWKAFAKPPRKNACNCGFHSHIIENIQLAKDHISNAAIQGQVNGHVGSAQYLECKNIHVSGGTWERKEHISTRKGLTYDNRSWSSCSSAADSSCRSDAATITSTENRFVLRSQFQGISERFPRYTRSNFGPHLPKCEPPEVRLPEPIPAPFTYQPLKENEIRVIEILRGKEHTMVSCIIHHIELGCGELYETVSYSWNAEPRDHLILVNGHSFQVSRTLEAALVQFRRDYSRQAELRKFACLELLAQSKGSIVDFAYPNISEIIPPKIVVWIDAVCINQQDLSERSRQISLMGDIYAQSVRLRIWLGVAERISDLAIRILVKNAEKYIHEGEVALREFIATRDGDRLCIGIGNLFSRPWFRRAWVSDSLLDILRVI